MKCVTARFQHHVGHCAGGASQFRVEVTGYYVHRLNGFNGRDHDLQQTGALVVVGSFNQIVVAFAHLAVDFSLQRAFGVEKLGVLEGGGSGTGNQVEQ